MQASGCNGNKASDHTEAPPREAKLGGSNRAQQTHTIILWKCEAYWVQHLILVTHVEEPYLDTQLERVPSSFQLISKQPFSGSRLSYLQSLKQKQPKTVNFKKVVNFTMLKTLLEEAVLKKKSSLVHKQHSGISDNTWLYHHYGKLANWIQHCGWLIWEHCSNFPSGKEFLLLAREPDHQQQSSQTNLFHSVFRTIPATHEIS